MKGSRILKAVHNTSLSSFDANHSLYDKVRPGFDPQFVSRFIKSLGVANRGPVLELAAGTGKFTKELVKHGVGPLIIVEPSKGMLESFQGNFPELDSREGSSYEIPLEDESVAAVVVAQGFHWFSDQKSLKEINRVLKPHGKLGLIWNFDTLEGNSNGPRLDVAAEDQQCQKIWQDIALQAIEHDRDVPQYRTGRWRLAFEDQQWFDAEHADSQFQYKMHNYPKDLVYDYWLSRSYITALPEEEKLKLKQTIESMVQSAPKSAFPSPCEIKQFLGSHYFVVQKK